MTSAIPLRAALAFAFWLCLMLAGAPAQAQLSLGPATASENARLWQFATPATGPTNLFAGRIGISGQGCVDPYCGQHARSLLRFDLSSIPPGSKILSVSITLNRLITVPPVTDGSVSDSVSIHRVTSAWNEATTWASHPGFDNSATYTATTAVAPDPTAVGTPVPFVWSGAGLVNAVQLWVNGSTNHGFIIVGDEGATATTRRFGDRASATPPQITITYRRPLGSSCSTADQCADPGGGTGPGFCTNNICCNVGSCVGRCFSGTPSCQAGSGTCGPFLPTGSPCTGQDSNPCTVETCNASHSCVTTAAPAATQCRAAGGDCDPADTCGGSTTCPANTILTGPCPSGIDSNVCTQDVCNGVSAACTHPAVAAGTVCRPPSDPSCDPAEVCSGTTCPPNMSTCPGDICAANPPAGTVCHPVTDVCDVAETCSGTSCPDDDPAAAGTSCRAASCQSATIRVNPASCTGASKACPAITTTNCAPGICANNNCRQTCMADSGCAPNAFCSGSTCEFKRPNGSLCSAGNQCTSGQCVDGYCCNAACTGQCEACDQAGNEGTCVAVSGDPHGARPNCAGDGSVCSGRCDGSNRLSCAYPTSTTVCTPASCTDGMATRREVCNGSGTCPTRPEVECAPFVCDVNRCYGDCQTDGHCADGYYCLAGADCVEKKENGDQCGGHNECKSAHCIDGVCCDTVCSGQCEACNLAGLEGECSPVTGPPAGMRTPCATDGSTCGGQCGGVVRTACVYPGPGVTCRDAVCENGMATLAADCSGTGYCPAEFRQDCGPAGCSGTSCEGECRVDSDCQLNEFCSARICTPRLPSGSVCGWNSACISELCVDGVCCNSSCSGQCEACDLPGSEGSCSPVPDGELPRGTRPNCSSDGSVCGGTCDGANRDQCSYPAEETPCRTGSCAAGVAVLAANCIGNGSCPALREQACAPLSCSGGGGVRCGGTGSCASNAACGAGEFCSGGICRPKLAIGQICGAHTDCITGQCIDGVCCDQACDGLCEACDVVGFIGTCTAIGSGLPHGGRPSCSGVGVCASQCTAENREDCDFPGGNVQCGGGHCTDGVQADPPICNGAGSCLAAETHGCSPYVCGPDDTCLTTCATDTDCVSGSVCRSGSCTAPDPDGGTAGAGTDTGGEPGSAGGPAQGTGGMTGAGGGAGNPEGGVPVANSGDDGGCGCRTTGSGSTPRALWLAAFGALLLARRRRPATASSSV